MRSLYNGLDLTRRRPLLLVDIDGVLNVYGVDTCPPGFAEHVLFPEDEEPVRLAPIHSAWLAELAQAFDLVWASAWGFQAHELLGPILSLAEFPYVPMPPIPFPPEHKVPAIASYVGDRPAVWIDDVLGPEARQWASSRRSPTLLIETDHRVGLTRGDVDEALAWASSLASRDV